MRAELGIHKDTEDDQEELMPSCCILNILDCLFVNMSSYCKNKTRPHPVWKGNFVLNDGHDNGNR